jgi:hypothetical protein
MSKAKRPDPKAAAAKARDVRLGELEQVTAVAGIPGPGRWLIAEYQPTALFSLKISSATSSVGKTLVVPTPYSIKMALVDAAFRTGLTDQECGNFLRSHPRTRQRSLIPSLRCVRNPGRETLCDRMIPPSPTGRSPTTRGDGNGPWILPVAMRPLRCAWSDSLPMWPISASAGRSFNF